MSQLSREVKAGAGDTKPSNLSSYSSSSDTVLLLCLDMHLQTTACRLLTFTNPSLTVTGSSSSSTPPIALTTSRSHNRLLTRELKLLLPKGEEKLAAYCQPSKSPLLLLLLLDLSSGGHAHPSSPLPFCCCCVWVADGFHQLDQVKTRGAAVGLPVVTPTPLDLPPPPPVAAAPAAEPPAAPSAAMTQVGQVEDQCNRQAPAQTHPSGGNTCSLAGRSRPLWSVQAGTTHWSPTKLLHST
mmetsp:Transcript_26017/g.36909  ORF Transcript_26017/g.36909 Transcript_26017/m.36909 type:complete len:240 (+) Transcript_26017:551-1270(+)